ncbi:MAG TPA: thiamine pyrophosphate-binding protein [Ilumatobacteraceae bacterium]|nr:thiamine pyrophosphate-binding protein [Ilumatobacteraceae bacterium]
MALDLVSAWRDAGTTFVFGVPGGGSNLDIVGSVDECAMRFVLTHTETAAAVMAGVVGELTGAPGACVVTRGPGTASAVNGVAQALLDRQPMVLVADCVGASERDRVSHQRIDQVALMAPATLASVAYGGEPGDLPAAIVARALGRRPGPVHVDFDPSGPSGTLTPPPAGTGRADIAPVRDLLRDAQRPVVIAGLGTRAHGHAVARDIARALDDLGRRTGVPILTTYKARGIISDAAAFNAGVMTGATIESPLLDAADLVVGVGLDPVELIPAEWKYPAGVVLIGSWPVDDSTFFGSALRSEVVGAPDVLAEFVGELTEGLSTTWAADAGQQFRRAALDELAAAVPPSSHALTPLEVVRIARAASPASTIATIDAGAHMLLAVPFWEVTEPGTLLISNGLATMGFALPAAIAAALVEPDRNVVCFTGDGGLGMTLAELETLARLELPVVVVVFNDSTLSLIAAKQSPVGHGGDGAVRYRTTDFAAIARGCGVWAETVADVEAFDAMMHAALARRGPALLDVAVDPSSYPAVLDAVRGSRT